MPSGRNFVLRARNSPARSEAINGADRAVSSGSLALKASGGVRINSIHAVDKNIVLLFTEHGIFRSTAASDTTNPGTTFEAIDDLGVGDHLLRRVRAGPLYRKPALGDAQ